MAVKPKVTGATFSCNGEGWKSMLIYVNEREADGYEFLTLALLDDGRRMGVLLRRSDEHQAPPVRVGSLVGE